MAEIARLFDQFRRAFDDEPWAGPSLLATLADLPAAQAAHYPVGNAHSMWEIVRHFMAWADVAGRRPVANTQLQISDQEDLPTQPAEADWQAALFALRVAHEQLLGVAAPLNDAALARPISAIFGAPQGPGATAYVMLHGVAQHYLYHAGQLALLRKAVV